MEVSIEVNENDELIISRELENKSIMNLIIDPYETTIEIEQVNKEGILYRSLTYDMDDIDSKLKDIIREFNSTI